MTDIGTVVGQQLKFKGLDKASKHYAADLERCKILADLLIVQHPEGITTDDVREAFLTRHERPLKIGNAVGAIFRDSKKWESVKPVRSTRASAHARWITVWRLKP